ncbi:malate dehydrogenase [Georgenia halophila]|uniref:Malate dehydrogenase n=1 Tax=Georgenia halophila TaxID=620889 RepID=A0ABP8LLH9_9MICO
MSEQTRDSDTPWPASVAILGAGGLIGSGVLYEIVTSGLCRHVTVSDPREGLVRAHAWDVTEAAVTAGLSAPRIDVVPAEELPPADVTVVAASRPEEPGRSRLTFATVNWELLRTLVPAVEHSVGDDGTLLLLSNPIDILAECLRRTSSLAAHQVLGYSLNDSTRFRSAVARELGVGVERVEAWVLGQHGDAQVPIFSQIRVDGAHVALDEAARRRVVEDIEGFFARWSALQSGRTSGWSSPKGVARMLHGMRDGGVLPTSIATDGTGYAPGSSFLGLPARLGRSGVVGVEEWSLSGHEYGALERAAELVTGVADELTGDVANLP